MFLCPAMVSHYQATFSDYLSEQQTKNHWKVKPEVRKMTHSRVRFPSFQSFLSITKQKCKHFTCFTMNVILVLKLTICWKNRNMAFSLSYHLLHTRPFQNKIPVPKNMLPIMTWEWSLHIGWYYISKEDKTREALPGKLTENKNHPDGKSGFLSEGSLLWQDNIHQYSVMLQ